MNHESLDIEFHHRVNVLCGSNGAGKSSVLQAIVLGLGKKNMLMAHAHFLLDSNFSVYNDLFPFFLLGGNAQDTKRSRAVKNFVRYNCTRAEIEVTLFNGSEESFRPNVYGKTITFRRIIQSTGTSSYFISGEENKTIYEGCKCNPTELNELTAHEFITFIAAAREERSKILSHFLIELDNPTSILQQEEAKKFFEGKSDSELYDFFLRATGIKSTRLSYDKASLDLNLGKNYVEKIRRDLEDENTELRELEEKLRKSQIVNDKKQVSFLLFHK